MNVSMEKKTKANFVKSKQSPVRKQREREKEIFMKKKKI